jgi:DNA polymerase I-like protein with 3'-5' exonuclease and polymerase domains
LSQLCEIDEHLHELDGSLLVTVHDSYVLEIPTENLQKLWDFFDYWVVDRVKERFPWLPVPFVYDFEAGPSYGELEEVHRHG